MATFKTWTRTLDPGPGPRIPDADPEKPGPWKTWNKYRIKKYVWLKGVMFYKHMRNVIYCLKVRVLTDT